MEREELLRSREYWLVKIQNNLFNLIENYRKGKNLNKTELASELGVTKGYISQVLNGDFDHKVSKLVDLALSFGKAPIFQYKDLDNFIKEDALSNKHTYSEFADFKPASLEDIQNKLYPEGTNATQISQSGGMEIVSTTTTQPERVYG